MHSPSFTVMVTASCSCCPPITVLPSCLVANNYWSYPPSMFSQCVAISSLRSLFFGCHPPHKVPASCTYYEGPSHFHFSPICHCILLYCPLLCQEHKHDIVLFHFLHKHLASLHILLQLTHTLIRIGKLPANRGQTQWKLLLCVFENYSKVLTDTRT